MMLMFAGALVTIAIGAVAQDVSDLAETRTTLEERLRELREIEAAVDAAKNEHATLEATIKELKVEAEGAQKAIAQRDAALEELEVLQRQQNRIAAEVRVSRTRLDAQKEEIAALETRRVDLDDKVAKARSEPSVLNWKP